VSLNSVLGELISKFREVDVHFESSGTQMALAAKLKGWPRISLNYKLEIIHYLTLRNVVSFFS
jgi:hypothetical protein